MLTSQGWDAMGWPHLALCKDLFKSAGLRLRLRHAMAEVGSRALTPVTEVHGMYTTAHLRKLLLLLWGVLRLRLLLSLRLHSTTMHVTNRSYQLRGQHS